MPDEKLKQCFLFKTRIKVFILPIFLYFVLAKILSGNAWPTILIKNNINKYFSDVTNIKPLAYIYIDDRAIKFNGNFNETIDEIKKFEVYWKK